MLSQVSKWGNSQGIRVSKKLLRSARISLNDEVEIVARDHMLIIMLIAKKNLAWYLDGYEDELDRYDWDTDIPEGREVL